MYKSEVKEIETLSKLKGKSDWKQQTSLALMQIYGSNSPNFRAKGNSGTHPGINPNVFLLFWVNFSL